MIINPISVNWTVDKLKKYARDWASDVVLISKTPVNTQSKQLEKELLIKRAKEIKNNVEKVVGAVPELSVMNSLGDVGAIFVPVFGAVALGSLAAMMYKWTLDAERFREENTDYRALIDNGTNPKIAAEIIATRRGSSDGIFSGSVGVTKTIAVVGIGAFLLHKFGVF